MNNWVRRSVIVIVLLSVTPRLGQTCSTFCLVHKGQPVFGKNYDWHLEDGLLIVNKRHVAKTALTQDNPVQWISKYGSITFNQYGREFPSGGINEAGLVVELMSLRDTAYPVSDSRPSLLNLEWIQYQLDNSSTVEDVIASDAHIRVAPTYGAKLHYLVCDSTGECVSVESLKGKMVYHTGETMPVKVLTNSMYAQSLSALNRSKGIGRLFLDLAEEKGSDSLARFIRAANMVNSYDPDKSASPVDYAFEILAEVAQGGGTKWRIVYDIARRRIYFRTLTHPQIRHIELSAFDFSCKHPVKVLDINSDNVEDAEEAFREYTQDINQALISTTFPMTGFLADMPNEMINKIVSHPERTVCQQD